MVKYLIEYYEEDVILMQCTAYAEAVNADKAIRMVRDNECDVEIIGRYPKDAMDSRYIETISATKKEVVNANT